MYNMVEAFHFTHVLNYNTCVVLDSKTCGTLTSYMRVVIYDTRVLSYNTRVVTYYACINFTMPM